MPEVTKHLKPDDIARALDPAHYLGAAEQLGARRARGARPRSAKCSTGSTHVSPEPASQPSTLREMALSLSASDIGAVEIPNGARVFGVLMESWIGESVVTLVASSMARRASTSAAVAASSVRGSTRPFARRRLRSSLLAITLHRASPSRLRFHFHRLHACRFYLRTFDGTKSREAAETDLTTPRVPLFSLFFAGQKVISAIRQLGLV